MGVSRNNVEQWKNIGGDGMREMDKSIATTFKEPYH